MKLAIVPQDQEAALTTAVLELLVVPADFRVLHVIEQVYDALGQVLTEPFDRPLRMQSVGFVYERIFGWFFVKNECLIFTFQSVPFCFFLRDCIFLLNYFTRLGFIFLN